MLLGAKPSFTIDVNDSVSKKLEHTGRNTGNQIIAYGLLKTLKCEEVSTDYSLDPILMSNRFDMIVIAAANFLFPGFDFSGMANLIEKTTLPCMMVGVGAQSNNYSSHIELTEGTRRLMKVVAERSKLIGVRGPFTAEVLAHLGITNVQTTGCPSYYMGGKPGLQIRRAPWHPNARLAVNSSRDVIRHAFDRNDMINVTRRIGQIAIETGADFIAQTEVDEIAVAERAQEQAEAITRVQAFYRGVATDGAIANWAERHCRVFWEVEEWERATRYYDFVLGTRFHGSMIALQQGVPACVICHDTRTTEMCQFLGMPSIALRDAVGFQVDNVFGSLDLDHLEKRHAELFPAFRAFLECNGAEHVI